MSHIITYAEEIRESGHCQQRPALEAGEKYLHEVDGKTRLRIVRNVHFDRYVWEDVAQWTVVIEEFFEEEFTLLSMHIGPSEEPVFIAGGLLGVLSRDKDLVQGELIVPSAIGGRAVYGIAPFGFFACRHLTKVVFAPMVVIAHEHAFAGSGIRELVFNDEVPVMLRVEGETVKKQALQAIARPDSKGDGRITPPRVSSWCRRW